eukprot:TRINITY_DN3434_c0_g1_i2.p2 TRINITY_DN3434_c0_g1~~TRINITY_DN3434_c0_g1_i2.p2  ORF type:complete len:133 (-),score=26.62 TRINITY_DN3434_c0_g1_i2:16-414(-)
MVVQAQYFHDPMDEPGYLQNNKFLPDINNAITINQSYKDNLTKLNSLLLVMFASDTVVVPRESSWFWWFKEGSNTELVPYNQTELYLKDTIGLQTLEKEGKLKFDSAPGDHMKFTLAWFLEHVITPYLINYI